MTERPEATTEEEAAPEPNAPSILAEIPIPPEVKDLPPEGRRVLLKRLRAAAPKTTSQQLANIFGVSTRTIDGDIAIIREENFERADAWACELVDTFDQYDDIYQVARASANQAKDGSRDKAANLAVALKTVGDRVDLKFRAGKWVEVPKRLGLGQDPNAEPVQIGLTPEAVALMRRREQSSSGDGDRPAGD